MNLPIVISADELTRDACLQLGGTLKDRVYALKIHNLYDVYGPSIVSELKAVGISKVWMDAKLHDIPNTVRLRAHAYAEAGIDILTVHASGGVEMMRAALTGAPHAEVYAVTVLTSLAEEQATEIYGSNVPDTVLRLARLAKEAGVHGIVCSPQEVAMLSNAPELFGLKFVVPGVRSVGKDVHDQKRVATPRATLDAGATLLVMGRQILEASDPLTALTEVEQELAA